MNGSSGGSRARRILVVEDEPGLSTGLQWALEYDGYEVLVEGDGTRALPIPQTWNPDLVVLDLMLPGYSGFELLQRWRASGQTMRIVIVSALTSEIDRINGLRLGADDYICKPFSLAEFLERIKAQLRRADEALHLTKVQNPDGVTTELSVNASVHTDRPREGIAGWRVFRSGLVTSKTTEAMTPIIVDVPNQRVIVGGLEARLTLTEMRVLRPLAELPGKSVSRAELTEAIGHDPRVKSGAVRQHVSRLRSKLDPIGAGLVVGMRGGYSWVVSRRVELLDG